MANALVELTYNQYGGLSIVKIIAGYYYFFRLVCQPNPPPRNPLPPHPFFSLLPKVKKTLWSVDQHRK